LEKTPRKYQYLLFDLDNTLMDFTAGEKTALFQTMEELSVPIGEKEYQQYLAINKAAWDRFEAGELDSRAVQRVRFEDFAAYLGFDPSQGEGMNARYVVNLGEQAILLPGAMEMLTRLAERYQLAVATNGLTLVQRARLKKSGFLPLLSGVFISQEMGVQKPHQAYFEAIFAAFADGAREKYLMIGDSLPADITGGINAGIDTLWYHPAGTVTPEITPTYTVRNYEEMMALLL
jgi:YjjG family noncanonical pyrimidine nucleotidase